MALLTKSPATSGDARNLVWHTKDNGATWYPSWTLSVSAVIAKAYNKNPRNSFFYDMPHDSVLTVANTMSHETALRVVARDYDGALLD
jgi:hypothetical protein